MKERYRWMRQELLLKHLMENETSTLWWDQYGICPSVDIQGDDDNLYKHVPIVDIELLHMHGG